MVPMLCTSSIPPCHWILPLGTDRGDRNTECDYSSAYVSLYTDSDLAGHGVRPPHFSTESYTHTTIYQMTFTIGRGNDIVRPVSPLSSHNEYRCCKCRFAWQSDKSRTGSSERKQKIYSRIWARLGIISSLTLNYDGRSCSEWPF